LRAKGGVPSATADIAWRERWRRDYMPLDCAGVQKSPNKEQDHERGDEARENAEPHCRRMPAPEGPRAFFNRCGHQQPRRQKLKCDPAGRVPHHVLHRLGGHRRDGPALRSFLHRHGYPVCREQQVGAGEDGQDRDEKSDCTHGCRIIDGFVADAQSSVWRDRREIKLVRPQRLPVGTKSPAGSSRSTACTRRLSSRPGACRAVAEAVQ
jgi:hypothetical protein